MSATRTRDRDTGSLATRPSPAEVWNRGDYQQIAFEHVIVSEQLCAGIGVSSAHSVLDVACGTGNTALAAARRRATVTGLDIAPNLLRRARARAAAEGLTSVEFREGDAADLPFPDASFDVVLSTFGASFVPDQARAARELVRVTKPGGTIALTVYTAQSLPSDVYRLGVTLAPAAAEGVVPAYAWADGTRASQLLGAACVDVRLDHHSVDACFRSAEDFYENNARVYGPVMTRLAGYTPEQRLGFRDGLLAILQQHNRASDGTLMAVFDYVTITARRTSAPVEEENR